MLKTRRTLRLKKENSNKHTGKRQVAKLVFSSGLEEQSRRGLCGFGMILGSILERPTRQKQPERKGAREAHRSPRIPESAFVEISDGLFCAQESHNSRKFILAISDVLFCAQESQHS